MEIISYIVLGFLIVISPGADFVLVFKNSLNSGRKAGLLTGLGIAVGVGIHITYSILGISHLLSQNTLLFSIISYAGSAYLIYLGVTGLFGSQFVFESESEPQKSQYASRYFIQGLFCNLLNPKTMLFFLSIFSQLVTPAADNNLFFVLMYGLYIAGLHLAWFCLVAFFVTSKQISTIFQQFGHKITQICGVGLIAFGTILLL